jgi:hypothetical protein
MAIGHSIDRAVMHQDVLVVGGSTHVDFGIIHSRVDRVLQSGERVFMRKGMIPTVRDDYEIVLGNRKLSSIRKRSHEHHCKIKRQLHAWNSAG